MLRTIVEKYGLVPGRGVVVFDPATLTALSLATTAAGAGLSATSTIAGGAAKKTEANYEAAQATENAGADIGASQRQMLDTQQRMRLAASKVSAEAGASGTNAGVGSPGATTRSITQRGTYQSMMDLFTGQNKATADLNRAAGEVYSGEAAKEGSDLAAAGTIAAGAGQMTSTFGRYKYPKVFGGQGRF